MTFKRRTSNIIPVEPLTLPAAQAQPTKLIKLTYRADYARWVALRHRATAERRSIQQLIDDALAAYLGEVG